MNVKTRKRGIATSIDMASGAARVMISWQRHRDGTCAQVVTSVAAAEAGRTSYGWVRRSVVQGFLLEKASRRPAGTRDR
eukprot:SAG25_NODE_337_length_9543_cov_4.171961_14_plen_79_part_00